MNGLWTGFLLTFLTGIMWSFVGIYYKCIAKWKLNLYDVMIATGGLSSVMTLLFFTKVPELVSGQIPLPSFLYFLFLFASSMINIGGSFILQRSMSYGKSGVSWAIGQSAFIFPFFVITLLFSEPWNLLKGAGTLLVLSGMILFAAKTSSSSATRQEVTKTKYGIQLAFLAFFVLGTAQSMTSASSFFSYQDTAMLRPFIACFCTFAAAVLCKIFRKANGGKIDRKAWILITVFSLQSVISTAFQFLALDKLKQYGMNGIFFPVTIGICIAGYSLWSVLFFKEKAGKYFAGGISLILAGIACYFLKDAELLSF